MQHRQSLERLCWVDIVERKVARRVQRRIKTQTVLPSAETAALSPYACSAAAFVLSDWPLREREQLLARLPEAVRHRAAFEPPFADEGVATRCHLLCHLRIDHVGEVR